jgi:death-on-curing protein
MISVKEGEEVHKLVIEMFGGSHGVRDYNALNSALARPFQTFDNRYLYSGTLEKGASLLESILLNHPFIDGNKRTGYVLLRLFLIQNGVDISATQELKYELVIGIASGSTKYEQILLWLQKFTLII